MEKHPSQIHSCFFPLLPLLKHFVPGSSQPCRAQAGRMVHGTWLLVWGDVGTSPLPCRVHLSPVLLQPGLLCCFGTGKGRDWQTGLAPVALPSTPRLWQNLVLLHAHSCALCCGKPCWECSGQCRFPTPTWALWPQPLWQLQAEPVPSARAGWGCPCCPCPALGLPNIQPSLCGFWVLLAFPSLLLPVVRPQQPQLCPGRARKAQWLQ